MLDDTILYFPDIFSTCVVANLISEIEKWVYFLDISMKSPYFCLLQCETKSTSFMDPKARSYIK